MITTTRLRRAILIAVLAMTGSNIEAPAAAQSSPKGAASRPVLNAEDLFDTVLQGTCWVSLPNASGTGWVLDRSQRLVVTNEHVVAGTDQVKVYFPTRQDGTIQTSPDWYLRGGTQAAIGQVIDRDTHRDLALIRLNTLPAGVKALTIASETARPGQEIMTIGAMTNGSQGLWGWVDGKVRNVVESNRPLGKLRTVESNLSTNSGNSGGAIVNNRGEVVAVHFASHMEARSVAYHVDSSELKKFLSNALPLVDPKDAATFAKRGMQRLFSNRYLAAQSDFSAALRLDPKNVSALTGRGVAYLRTRKYEQALADLNQAAELNPEWLDALHFRGETLAAMGKYTEAIQDFDRVLEMKPNLRLALTERGACRMLLSKFVEAEKDFTRAIEIDPKCVSAWQGRGLAREKLGRIEDAIADMKKGVSCAPTQPDGYSNLGYMLFRTRRYQEAGLSHDAARKIDPTNPLHVENIGHCLKQMEKYRDAIELFSKALEMAATYRGSYRTDVCLCSRGFCQRKLGNQSASLADHNLSLKVNPNNAETYYQRAWTYKAMGQTAQVRADYDKAISLNADYAKKESPVPVRATTSSYSPPPVIRR